MDLIWEALGISWAWAGSQTGPGTPQWAGLHSRPGGSIVLPGSRDPGNGQSVRRVGGSGSYYQSSNCLIPRTFNSELLDLRLRKVTVEFKTQEGDCLTVWLDCCFAAWWHPLKRGRRIYVYVYAANSFGG